MHIAVVRSNITVIDSQTLGKTAPLILSQSTLNFVSEGNCCNGQWSLRFT
jgi:hypothetical protein